MQRPISIRTQLPGQVKANGNNSLVGRGLVSIRTQLPRQVKVAKRWQNGGLLWRVSIRTQHPRQVKVAIRARRSAS
jgi:hypothetical protein